MNFIQIFFLKIQSHFILLKRMLSEKLNYAIYLMRILMNEKKHWKKVKQNLRKIFSISKKIEKKELFFGKWVYFLFEKINTFYYHCKKPIKKCQFILWLVYFPILDKFIFLQSEIWQEKWRHKTCSMGHFYWRKVPFLWKGIWLPPLFHSISFLNSPSFAIVFFLNPNLKKRRRWILKFSAKWKVHCPRSH